MSQVAGRDTRVLIRTNTVLLSLPVSHVEGGDTRVDILINTILLSRTMSQVTGRDTRRVICTHNSATPARESRNTRRYPTVIHKHNFAI